MGPAQHIWRKVHMWGKLIPASCDIPHGFPNNSHWGSRQETLTVITGRIAKLPDDDDMTAEVLGRSELRGLVITPPPLVFSPIGC